MRRKMGACAPDAESGLNGQGRAEFLLSRGRPFYRNDFVVARGAVQRVRQTQRNPVGSGKHGGVRRRGVSAGDVPEPAAACCRGNWSGRQISHGGASKAEGAAAVASLEHPCMIVVTWRLLVLRLSPLALGPMAARWNLYVNRVSLEKFGWGLLGVGLTRRPRGWPTQGRTPLHQPSCS